MPSNRSDVNGTAENSSMPLAELIPVSIVICIMILTAVIGNLLVICSYLRDKALQTIYNMYIFNLAIADMLIGLFSITFYYVFFIYDWKWPLGRIMCKVYLVLDFTFCLESVLIMVVVSHDRLILVTKGARYLHIQTRKQALTKIAVTWVCAFLLYGPAVIGWDYWVGKSINADDECTTEFSESVEFLIPTSFIEFLIPLTLLLVFNSVIYSKIRKRSIWVHSIQTTSSLIPTQLTDVSGSTHTRDAHSELGIVPGNNPEISESRVSDEKSDRSSRKKSHTAASGKRQRQERKAARSLALLVVVFAMCYTPYTVASCLMAWRPGCVDDDLYKCFIFLLWSKSCLNPFLYAYSSNRFRTNFKELLTQFYHKKGNPRIVITSP